MSLTLPSTNPNMEHNPRPREKLQSSSSKSDKGKSPSTSVAAGKKSSKKHKQKVAAAAIRATAAATVSEDTGASDSEASVPPPLKKLKLKRSFAAVVAGEKDEQERDSEFDAQSEPEAAAPFVASSDARHLAKQLKELKEIGRHFSKIANRFAFEDNTAAYQVWAIQFEAELLNNDLDAILTSDPSAVDQENLMLEPELCAQQQKTVYHMIFQCVPKVKLSVVVTLPIEQHTGFGAWQALRQFYIGDEQAYLTSLESKFQRLSWEGSEAFPTFETRCESLLNELQNAGAAKAEHVKKSVFMAAIEDSPHKDAQGNSVFVRLNTVSKIHMEKPYRDWLTAIRIEAQQIQDSVHKRGIKRGREERKEAAVEVSFVAPSMSPHNAAASNRRISFVARQGSSGLGSSAGPGGQTPLCRNMRYTGRCTFGTRCKFSHTIPPGLLGKPDREQSGPSSGESGKSSAAGRGPCWDFQRGRCNRGDRCRFAHVNSAAAGDREGFSSGASRLQAQQFEVMQVTDGASPLGPQVAHRVIVDSGASYHFTPCREFIRNIRLLPSPVPVQAAFGQRTFATHGGDGFIPFGEDQLAVGEMIFCKDLRDTLLSYVLLIKNGHKVTLDKVAARGTLLSKDSSFSLRVSMHGNVLSLESVTAPTNRSSVAEPVEVNVTTRGQRKQSVQAPAPTADADAQPEPRIEEQKQADASSDEPIRAIASSNGADVQARSESKPALSAALAHARYGHLCGRKIDQLLDHKAADGMILSSKHPSHKDLISRCDACMRAKMSRLAFSKEMHHQADGPNDKAVADVCGPIKTRQVINGVTVVKKQYVSLITDVYSRNVSLMILDSKDAASDHCISYMHSARITTGRDLKHFHTDGGTEYNRAERVMQSRGIKVTRTPIHTPQRNAVSERKNRTMMEMVRAFLEWAGLDPDEFWVLAFEAAVITHNRVTVVKGLHKTQHELFTGQKPNLSLLRVFGCDAFVRCTTENGKLAPRAEKGIFVGYDVRRELCYRVRVGNQIVVSRDVRFLEESFSVGRTQQQQQRQQQQQQQQPQALGSSDVAAAQQGSIAKPGPNINTDSESEAEDSEVETAQGDRVDAATARRIAALESKEKQRAAAAASSVRRTGRMPAPIRRTGVDLDNFGQVAFAIDSSSRRSKTDLASVAPNTIRQSDVAVPATRRAAMRSPHWTRWECAMHAELESIKDHDTFSLVAKPDTGVNIVSCKWVFAVKAKDGWVSRFKARLVARGFSQQFGVDFEETYSPVLRYKTLRMLLSIICSRDMTLELMDVETAYLNAPLKEKVHMAQPEGFEEGGRSFVWLLHKALYGLKQSGREWHTHLNAFVLSLGFTRCKFDPCVYLKLSRTGRLIILSIYVDDIPSASYPQDVAEWEEIKQQFFAQYKIKFLGTAEWFLNMRITRDRSRGLLWLDQQAYVEQLLEEFGFDESKVVATPGSQEQLSRAGAPSSESEIAAMRSIPYRKAVGSLTYLANSSRPDIAHAVNYVAQYSQNPGESHWRAVKMILRYLSGTKNYALQFAGAANKVLAEAGESNAAAMVPALRAFADANWGGCLDTRRSTTGWIVALGNDILDWQSRKQTTVALSTCEAEYMAIAAAAQAVAWTRGFLQEMEEKEAGVAKSSSEDGIPMAVPILFSDNKAAIAMAKNDVLHSRSKHIDIKHHFIREQLEAGSIALQWISSAEQLADILTKALPPRIFAGLRDQLVVPRPQA